MLVQRGKVSNEEVKGFYISNRKQGKEVKDNPNADITAPVIPIQCRFSNIIIRKPALVVVMPMNRFLKPVPFRYKSYLPNGYDIYNMHGNEAEMVADKSYTKGGGWHSKSDKLKIEATGDYSSGAIPTVGFRIVIIKEATK